jgi:hypothetical protein
VGWPGDRRRVPTRIDLKARARPAPENSENNSEFFESGAVASHARAKS